MNIKRSFFVFIASFSFLVAGITTAHAEDFDLSIILDGTDSVQNSKHISPGGYLQLDTYLTNSGPDSAPGRILVTGEILPECPYLVGWYLSTDSVITSDDIQVGGFCPNGLEAGQTLRFWADVYVPVNIEGGMYYFGAIADYNESVIESDETNNTGLGNKVVIR